MQVRHRIDQAEAQPVAGRRAAAFASIEAMCQARQIFGVHAGAVVFHGQDSSRPAVLGQVHADPNPARRVAQRVLHQVRDRLRQQFLVAVDGDAGRHLGNEPMPCLLRVRAQGQRMKSGSGLAWR